MNEQPITFPIRECPHCQSLNFHSYEEREYWSGEPQIVIRWQCRDCNADFSHEEVLEYESDKAKDELDDEGYDWMRLDPSDYDNSDE